MLSISGLCVSPQGAVGSLFLFEQQLLYELLEAGGKPSTWFPPEGLVYLSENVFLILACPATVFYALAQGIHAPTYHICKIPDN